MASIMEFLRNQQGATAIEYGVMAGILGIGMVAIMTAHNGAVSRGYGRISNNLSATPGLS